MNCIFKITIFTALALFLEAQGVAEAQMFAPAANGSKAQQYSTPRPSPAAVTKAKVQTESVNGVASVADSATVSKSSNVTQKSGQKFTTFKEPLKNKNTSGKFQIRFVGGKPIIGEQPAIFLYMRDFKMSTNFRGDPECTVKFFVNNTAKQKITNISYRLRWPDIETGLSFDDVEPNRPNYFSYTLLGKGCYSMDKAPNIVVNRCRIKGMSQKQCADIISWIN